MYKSQLISLWPINPSKGLADPFQHEAFAYLKGHPTEPFFRLDTMKGRTVFRYLTADRATAQSCLDCHNNHPLSPKRDFKLNDVMGALEIIIPADQYLQENRDDLTTLLAGGTVLLLVLFAMIATGVQTMIRRPLARLAEHMDQKANKITGGLSIPSTGSGGRNELTRFAAFFDQMRTLIASQQRALQDREAVLHVRNISLQEQIESQTQACLGCERHLQTLINTVPDAVLYLDLEGTIRWCNDKMGVLAGWAEDDLVGQPLWTFLTSESSATMRDGVAAIKRENGNSFQVECVVITKTGGAVRGQATITGEQEEGRVVGLVLVLRGLTERQRQYC